MATTVNIEEAATHFSALVQRALEGEEVIVARAGTPVIRFLPLGAAEMPKRQLGSLADRGYLLPDDIKAPFCEEVEEMFYGTSQKS